MLGPVQVYDDGAVTEFTVPKARLLLATLALSSNTVVSFERLREVLWDGSPPASAQANLRSYAVMVRRAVGNGGLLSRCGGYQLTAAAGEVDAGMFARLAEAGHRHFANADYTSACEQLRRALALWRGPAGEGLPPSAALTGQLDALNEQRLLAIEDLMDARLALGEHASLVGELGRLVAEHPLRERCWAALIMARYRCGAVAAALNAFAEARAELAEKLGVDPGPRLRQLHTAVLRHDPALEFRPPRQRVCAGAAVRRPDRLPHHGRLIGRRPELDAVARAVARAGVDDRPAVVVVHGPAGAGKSAVAAYAARGAAERFPDGRLYLNLAAGPADQDAVRLLSALEATAPWLPDEQSAAAEWRAALADRRLLVVLDHCVSAARLRPLLPASGGSAMLVTADSPLGAVDATARVEVGRLRTGAAVGLLAAFAGHRVAAEPGAAAKLVARCDHLPLAIRAAAARLVDEPGLRVGALLDRTAVGGALLDDLAVADLDPRARLLHRLGAVRRVDPDAAEAFRRLGEADIGALPVGAVRLLAEHGLVEAGGQRVGKLAVLLALELADRAASPRTTTPSNASGRTYPKARES